MQDQVIEMMEELEKVKVYHASLCDCIERLAYAITNCRHSSSSAQEYVAQALELVTEIRNYGA